MPGVGEQAAQMVAEGAAMAASKLLPSQPPPGCISIDFANEQWAKREAEMQAQMRAHFAGLQAALDADALEASEVASEAGGRRTKSGGCREGQT